MSDMYADSTQDLDSDDRLDILERIVYIGNGTPSLVTRITAQESYMKLILWANGAIILMLFGIFGTLIDARLK